MISSRKGFTLLEVMIALAILAVSLVAITAINAGAINMHNYSKRLTIATMLARSKMADIESELQGKGLPGDDEKQDGNFEEEGFAAYKWEAQIIRPKTEKISTDQLFSMMGMGAGGDGKSGGLANAALANKLPGAGASPGAAAAGSMLAGPMQMQMQGMLDQLGKTMREVRLTVMWQDGKLIDKFTVVTHMVSLGPGTDQANVTGAVPGQPTLPDGTPLNPGQMGQLGNVLGGNFGGGAFGKLGLPAGGAALGPNVPNLPIPPSSFGPQVGNPGPR